MYKCYTFKKKIHKLYEIEQLQQKDNLKKTGEKKKKKTQVHRENPDPISS